MKEKGFLFCGAPCLEMRKRTFSYGSWKWNPFDLLPMWICPIQHPYLQENVRLRILIHKKISGSDPSSIRKCPAKLHWTFSLSGQIFTEQNLWLYKFLRIRIFGWTNSYGSGSVSGQFLVNGGFLELPATKKMFGLLHIQRLHIMVGDGHTEDTPPPS